VTHWEVVESLHGAALLGGERRGERRVRAIGLGRDHHAAGVLVQPVHDAGPEHAADPRQIAAVVQQRVDQRAAGVTGGGMHDHPGGLVDRDQIGVLEQDRERDRLGGDLERLGRGDAHDDPIAELDARARLGRRRAAELDHAVLDQPLDGRARQLGDRPRDDRVEPAARPPGVDLELVDGRVVVAVLVGGHQIFDLT